MERTGIIFINAQGEYACECANTGFGSKHSVIRWVKELNKATVFVQPQSSVRQSYTELKGSIGLPASAVTTVRLLTGD